MQTARFQDSRDVSGPHVGLPLDGASLKMLHRLAVCAEHLAKVGLAPMAAAPVGNGAAKI